MAKVFNYIAITTGLILLFELAGIPTAANTLLNNIGLTTNAVSVNTSPFFNFIFSTAGILIITSVGIAISFFARTSPINFIILPLVTTQLTLFLGSLVSIMQYSLANHEPWISSIFLLVLGGLTVAYILALVEFFMGKD